MEAEAIWVADELLEALQERERPNCNVCLG